MRFIGIDPGKSGGIAWIDTFDGVTAVKMPDTERDILDLIVSCTLVPAVALIEDVHSFPTDAAKTTFTFGTSYGQLRMALIACCIRFETVAPTVWQKSLKLINKRGLSKTQKKNEHKARAQELFPDLVVTHHIADALLIAEYCMRVNTNGKGND